MGVLFGSHSASAIEYETATSMKRKSANKIVLVLYAAAAAAAAGCGGKKGSIVDQAARNKNGEDGGAR
ncbi:hypothetical protein ACMFMG_000360 [Clarireedia jacksonii]